MPGKVYRTAIYCRLSREDGDKVESNSIASQRAICEDYIARHDDLEIVCEPFVDDGYSGVSFNRPNFKKLEDAIRKGAIDCIVVKDLSRFSRNYIDGGRYLEKIFPQLGIRFIAVNDAYDSLTGDPQSDSFVIPFKNLIKNISHSGKVSNDFSLFRRFCCINRCFRCSCGKFSIVHGVQAAIGFQAVAIGEKGDLPETHPVQPRTESKRPCRLTRAKPASKGSDRALSV